MPEEPCQIQQKSENLSWNCLLTPSDRKLWTKESDDSEPQEVAMAVNYVEFIYVIMLRVGKSIYKR